ncbi:uncharacterized protein EI97DRAFT_283729 [Westerdykella ornata]|uniref:Secreted protein n=1 Tax=Westerdykella ornata TaxID=318751 RepID=A0A6A6J4A4_WESOR|nr:uncharacterized protein EI97DRAFT_283729 [Westerdykella ornata]KAF2271400.1 hypothetical protein EI97DRAFT_283729 [Westerdykella ornata]
MLTWTVSSLMAGCVVSGVGGTSVCPPRCICHIIYFGSIYIELDLSVFLPSTPISHSRFQFLFTVRIVKRRSIGRAFLLRPQAELHLPLTSSLFYSHTITLHLDSLISVTIPLSTSCSSVKHWLFLAVGRARVEAAFRRLAAFAYLLHPSHHSRLTPPPPPRRVE